jgi:hypothetical protein
MARVDLADKPDAQTVGSDEICVGVFVGAAITICGIAIALLWAGGLGAPVILVGLILYAACARSTVR